MDPNPLNTDSTKYLIAGMKGSSSTTDLEVKESKLKRKAADMLLSKALAEGNSDIDEFKYEERAE